MRAPQLSPKLWGEVPGCRMGKGSSSCIPTTHLGRGRMPHFHGCTSAMEGTAKLEGHT